MENLRESRGKHEQELAKFDAVIKEADDEQIKDAVEKEKQNVQDKLDRLDRIIAKAEAKIGDD